MLQLTEKWSIAARHDPRFAAPDLQHELAKSGATFYGWIGAERNAVGTTDGIILSDRKRPEQQTLKQHCLLNQR